MSLQSPHTGVVVAEVMVLDPALGAALVHSGHKSSRGRGHDGDCDLGGGDQSEVSIILVSQSEASITWGAWDT